MPDRSEYTERRRRNLIESAEAAAEFRDALIAIPASERARLLAANPNLLARIPTPALRVEVLLAGTELPPEIEMPVMQALARSDITADLPAVITAALVPALPPTEPAAPLPIMRHGGAGVVTPRHRVNNPWLRSLINLGRPLQAAALAAIITVGVDSWQAVKAATSSDLLPTSSVFSQVATWPTCKEGLRSRTDFCIYTVSKALDWAHALVALNANNIEEQTLRAVNVNLGDDNHSWPPETRLLVWRGIRPEGSR